MPKTLYIIMTMSLPLPSFYIRVCRQPHFVILSMVLSFGGLIYVICFQPLTKAEAELE